MKFGYLGPQGTFSEKAVRYFAKDSEIKAYKTIRDVLFAVENSECDFAVVPIENTSEGTVNATIDTIIFDTELFIQAELILPIQHSLMTKKKQKNIDKIISHPQALAQCRDWIFKNYPNADIIEASSTSEASRIVSNDCENSASIGTDICAGIYNLEIIANNIQDSDYNKTYFILVSKNNTSAADYGNKISLAFSALHRPGNLYKILDIFSIFDINLTKINSRPMKNQEKEYVFFVDIEGFSSLSDIEDAFKLIKRKTKFFKILGSYNVLNYTI